MLINNSVTKKISFLLEYNLWKLSCNYSILYFSIFIKIVIKSNVYLKKIKCYKNYSLAWYCKCAFYLFIFKQFIYKLRNNFINIKKICWLIKLWRSSRWEFWKDIYLIYICIKIILRYSIIVHLEILWIISKTDTFYEINFLCTHMF